MAGSCFYLSDIESIYVFDASVTLSLNVISQVLLVAFCHFIANADESQHDLFNCLVLLCISSVFSGDLAVFNLYLYNYRATNQRFLLPKGLKISDDAAFLQCWNYSNCRHHLGVILNLSCSKSIRTMMKYTDNSCQILVSSLLNGRLDT